MDNDLKRELLDAQEKGCHPRCPECHKPLVIEEVWCRVQVWKWDALTRCYRKYIEDEGTHRPCCRECQAEFSFFMGSSQLLQDTGLHY